MMEILGLVDIPLTLVLVVMIIVFFYVFQTWHFNTWTNLGIQGPKPRFLFGNMPPSFSSNGKMVEYLKKWRTQYGKTYGMFLYREPVFVTSDPEVIKEVAVKSFSNFSDRHNLIDRLLTKFSWKMLFSAKGHTWRRFRHVMSPAFTSGKLKALHGYMTRCSKTLVDVLKDIATKQEDMDAKETYQRFTMDVIAITAFGLDTNLQKGAEKDTHDMIQAMKSVLSNFNSVPLLICSTAFPFLAPLLRATGYTAVPHKSLNFFKQCLKAIIRQRDENPQEAKKRVDFLQQMLDLRVAPGEEVTDMEDDSGGTKTDKKVTDEEVGAQGMQVFLAGFETTASTLQFLTYCLALHQDVQDRLHQEIVQVVGQGEVKYEHLQHLKYLECVILETLRMYPFVSTLNRFSKRPIDIKGYHIPQGVAVYLDIYTTMRDPDLYPDPFTFNPDRFTEGRDSLMASLPFGVGPRQCIGMRLAMQEVKTAVIHVLRAVRFVPCDKTPKDVKFSSWLLLFPNKPVIVRPEIRT